MPSVFVNYRSGDTDGVAALIERELSRRFGTEVFFRASKSIPPGDDFTQALLRAVRASDVLLAFIGPHWLEVRDGGTRDIDRPGDWTRREIIEAFQSGVRIVPILVGGIRPLREGDLPDELARLALCQYLRFDQRSAQADLDQIAARLAELIPGLRKAPGDDGGTPVPEPGRPGGTSGPGGISNNPKGDLNIGTQAETIIGDVRVGDVGPSRRSGTPGGEGER